MSSRNVRWIALGAVVALMVPLLTLSSSTAAPSTARAGGLVRYDTIPTLVLDLPGGDRLALGAPSLRKVMQQRYDATTGSWSAPRVFFRQRGLECGDLDARTANGAVAVILECDRGWYEDQAPTRSVALYSADAQTWSRHRLLGEAYEEPGISPSGGNAVWPIGQGRYATWTATAGFTDHVVSAKNEEYTLTAVIADSGAVSYAYGAPLPGEDCGLIVLTRTADGPVSRQVVALPQHLGCGDTGLENVDSDTMLLGDNTSLARRTTIARTSPEAPFVVTRISPEAAPGLLMYSWRARRAMYHQFFTAPGLPLYSIGSPDRQRLQVQTYDAEAQRWSPAQVVYDHGFPGCTWGPTDASETLGVVLADITCYPRRRDDGYPPRRHGFTLPAHGHRVLATTDGTTWHDLRSRGPLGVSTDRAHVAVLGRTTATLLSRERGVLTVPLPQPVPQPCSFVVPAGPDSAALLVPSRRSRGWPARLYATDLQGGWALDRSVDLPTPPRGDCRRGQANLYDEQVTYGFGGRRDGYALTVERRGTSWKVHKSRY